MTRKAQPEFELQKQIAQYLRLQYPKVMFLSDVKAAVKLTIPQAVRLKSVQANNDFACPDLMIFARRWNYGGLFLELKAKSPYLKSGLLSSDAHIQRQRETLHELNREGYAAEFVWSFEQAKELIDWYLGGGK